MCYAVGSIQQATSTCPMCKVFKPSASRCPHVMATCSNTANHPRHEVMYLKNAEVQTFNGCGFCKWAKTNPPPRLAGYQNPGWPGCCRPPAPGEYKLIGAADWPTVSLVHHIPIPPEIKTILDGITSPRGTSPLASPTGTVRSAATQAPAPAMSRRSSYNVSSPTRSEAVTAKVVPATISTKARSGGSPQQVAASLSGNARGATGDVPMASLSKASAVEPHQSSRRSAMDVFAEKRPDPSNMTHSPGRKHAELSGSVARRSSERRPSITAAAPSAPAGKVTVDATPQRRRTAPSTPNASSTSLPQANRPVERPAERITDRAPVDPVPSKRGSPLEEAVERMSLSSASSSSSGSGSSETTLDGGFTDYLSDESEAELQRQAEAKAAILAQNQLEELEFKAARQQLAHVDLRPPKSWRGDVHSATPRSQVQSSRNTSTYGQSFTAAPAYAASAASTPSRG
ncbi:hypothetical protein C8Q73DRAFT_754285 [Cubamyces lactineus]|nr:hypothetical protein C8Q73DRAFT_754285 [Cubamyces lactineus]